MSNQNALIEYSKSIASRKEQIRARLPKHIDAERIVKIAQTALVKNPGLLKCSIESILMAIMQGSELGLEPGGALGEGYLVPYGQTCQFIPGYRGFISLARRSGLILKIEAHAVYAHDEFVVEFGLEPKLIHKPLLVGDRGDIIGFYSVALLKDTPIPQYEYMTKGEIDAIKGRSKASSYGPWITDYPEMGKKTVIRRLAKLLPLSVEMANAFQMQANAEDGRFDPSLEVVMDGAQKNAEIASRAESVEVGP